MRHSWFPAILAGLTLLLGLVIGVVWWGTAPRVPVDEATVVAPTQEAYRAAVTRVIAIYKEDDDAAAAENALALLRVPADALQMHLDLVIAFGKLAAGDADGATRRAILAGQYPWLGL